VDKQQFVKSLGKEAEVFGSRHKKTAKEIINKEVKRVRELLEKRKR
jgi:hypothetical protein